MACWLQTTSTGANGRSTHHGFDVCTHVRRLLAQIGESAAIARLLDLGVVPAAQNIVTSAHSSPALLRMHEPC